MMSPDLLAEIERRERLAALFDAGKISRRQLLACM